MQPILPRFGNEVVFEILCDLAHQALKRKLAHEKVVRFLEFANLPQCNCSRTELPRLLETSCHRRCLTGSLSGELLTWRFGATDLRAVCFVRAILMRRNDRLLAGDEDSHRVHD